MISASPWAVTARIDDTGTSLESITRMYWRQLAPSRKVDNTMEGGAQVQVRLNLAPWVGRTGRIFMVLPEQSMGPIRASWPAHGRFSAGSLSSGQRALIHAGPITSPIMEGLLVLKLEVDGTRLQSVQRLSFHFEIDLDQ
jgi:hypothetical protein